MKNKDKADLHLKSQEELRKLLLETKQELIGLQLEQAQRKLKNTKSMALKKDDIARLQTIMREKELAEKRENTSKENVGESK
jgi:ribosomal protein L29